MILLDLSLKMHLYNFSLTIIFLQNESLDMAQGYQKTKSVERRRGKMRWSRPHQSPVSTLHPHRCPLLQSLIFTPFYNRGQIFLSIWLWQWVWSRNWIWLAVYGQVFTWHGQVFNIAAATIHLRSHLWVVLTLQVWVRHIAHVKSLLLYFFHKAGPKNTTIPYKK